MRIQYANVEEVDSVLTVTLAERNKEKGFLFHMMRVVPGENDGFDPELENYELATRSRLCEGGVVHWSLDGHRMMLNLTSESAAALGIGPTQSFELDVSDDELARIGDALRVVFSPVGFGGCRGHCG